MNEVTGPKACLRQWDKLLLLILQRAVKAYQTSLIKFHFKFQTY